MKAKLKISCLTLVFAAVVNCQQSIQHHQIEIDHYLNSKFTLFPNQTLQHHQNLEDETLQRFQSLLDDEKVLNSAYDKFKLIYGEKHGTLETFGHFQRKDIFKENLVFVFHHNLHARMKLHSTFEMEVNKFADMHLDEFKQERLGLIIPQDNHSHEVPHHNLTEAEVRSLPSHFDWRDHEVISEVKDQMKCGSCVMFSVTSALEGHHAINRNKEMLDLSEQSMVDCATKENGYSKNRGCEGNTFPDTLKFAKDYGITSEHLYPYEGKQGKCKYDGKNPTIRVKDFKRLPDKTIDVKHSVANTGPASIGILVWKPLLFYSSGVYDYCSYPSSAVGGHAMAITGFNENGKYYIIKNQWGKDWGENGFIRYSHTDSRCGLEKLAYTYTI